MCHFLKSLQLILADLLCSGIVIPILMHRPGHMLVWQLKNIKSDAVFKPLSYAHSGHNR